MNCAEQTPHPLRRGSNIARQGSHLCWPAYAATRRAVVQPTAERYVSVAELVMPSGRTTADARAVRRGQRRRQAQRRSVPFELTVLLHCFWARPVIKALSSADRLPPIIAPSHVARLLLVVLTRTLVLCSAPVPSPCTQLLRPAVHSFWPADARPCGERSTSSMPCWTPPSPLSDANN